MWALRVVLFSGMAAWSSTVITLPFLIADLAHGDRTRALAWTGAILSVTPIVTVLTTPLWGMVASRRGPKLCFLVAEGFQASCLAVLAAATSLVELFAIRVLLGATGAVSTFAFMLARHVARGNLAREIGRMQAAITGGQLLGPLVGTLVVAHFGYATSFVGAAAVLGACALLVGARVPSVPPAPPAAAARAELSRSELAAACAVLGASNLYIFFLNPLLPHVLPALGVPPASVVVTGGWLAFLSGAAAAVGALPAARLAERFGERRVLLLAAGLASVLVAALGLASTVWLFAALRVLGLLVVAPIVPLVLARVAERASGAKLGFVDSTRIAIAFLAPVSATTFLIWLPAGALFPALAIVAAGAFVAGFREWARRSPIER